ncbi:MAG: transporter substrate-binding domain-containing protein [Desulfosarcinaceae bacterium]|nr:transporter substrate-binding domain-containing protein [Desulfosarcinaceae bacterium]
MNLFQKVGFRLVILSGRKGWGTWAILAAILLFWCPLTARAEAPLRIAYTDFPPFHYRSSGEPLQGFFFEIISEALQQRMGIPLKWSAYPWKRCQQNVRNGIDDALLTVPTTERLHYTATHPNPFYLKDLHLFTRKGHPRLTEMQHLQTIADIRDKSFTVVTYSGNSWHQTHVASLGIVTHETDLVENVWRMLAAGRGDLVIEWPHGAWPAIRRLDLTEEILDIRVSLAAMPFHLLIRKNSPFARLLPPFDDTIQAMAADGTIRAIMAPFEGK